MAERMKVLSAYDGSKHADAALDDLPRAGLPRAGEALVVSVSEVMAVPGLSSAEVAGAGVTSRRVISAVARAQSQSSQSLAEAQKLAAGAGRRLRAHLPGWEVRAEALAGTPSWELSQKAARWGADLVVVGSQGRTALGRLLLGSVSKKVAVEAPCSVRVARRGEEDKDGAPPRIIIGVDGSSEAECAVRAVGERVWPEGTQVRIVAVDDGTSNEEGAYS
jgi:nucleotide-binding universal stress UspA family protein